MWATDKQWNEKNVRPLNGHMRYTEHVLREMWRDSEFLPIVDIGNQNNLLLTYSHWFFFHIFAYFTRSGEIQGSTFRDFKYCPASPIQLYKHPHNIDILQIKEKKGNRPAWCGKTCSLRIQRVSIGEGWICWLLSICMFELHPNLVTPNRLLPRTQA